MDLGILGAIGSAGVLAAMGCLVRRKISATIRLLSVQGIMCALAATLIGLQYQECAIHMFIAAALALIGKTWLIPRMLAQVARKVDAAREPHGLGTIWTTVLGSALILLVYLVTPPLEGVAGQLLAPSLAMIMLGFFMTVGRRLAVSQAIGLVIMENGVFLAGTGLTYGMPLIVELGTLLDLLIGVGVMGVLISRMHETLSTTDTSHLQNLKG